MLVILMSCRPVDCYTHEPLVFLPGFVNSTIYGDRVETGWGFGPYFLHSANFWLPGMLQLHCKDVCSNAGHKGITATQDG